MEARSRNILLDIFKLMASIFVIALHCGFLFDQNEIAYQILTNGFFKIIIPFFFCINGFFLYTVFQKKQLRIWIKRLAILYFFWMFVYSYFWTSMNNFNPLKMLVTIFFGFNHLWYLSALFFGGILLYLIRNISNVVLLISIPILFSIAVCIQYLGLFHVFEHYPLLDKLFNYPPSYRNAVFYALPFLTIGYLIRKTNLHLRYKKKTVLWLFILSILLLVIDSLVNYHYLTHKVMLNINSTFIFIGPIVLIMAFTFRVTSTMHSKLLSDYAIAIYLIHPMIIFLIASFFDLGTTLLTLLTTILSLIASYLLIKINSKLKFIL